MYEPSGSGQAATRTRALLDKLASLRRSWLAGCAATAIDLAVLASCIGVLGMSARSASAPALLAGAAVQFFGNRHYAFRATGGPVRRQAVLFTIAEVVALGLNALLFDVVAARLGSSPFEAVVARVLTTHVVFLLWSHPVWSLIFRGGPGGPARNANVESPPVATETRSLPS